MPGPVSDSHDPERGTAANRHEIAEGLHWMHERLEDCIGAPPQYILDVVRGEDGPMQTISLSRKQLRILSFACATAEESL